MKRLIVVFLCFALANAMFSQVVFKFEDGIYDPMLKAKVERNVSNLLSEINNAQQRNDAILNLRNVTMENFARQGLCNLWKTLPFRCIFKMNVQPCLKDATEYEIRQIPVRVVPKDDSYRGMLQKELTISFNKSGVITGVRMSLDNNSYQSLLMGDAKRVDDIEERRTILKFVEDFGSFYVEKNLQAIYNIFDENALIVTGRVITPSVTNSAEISDQRKRVIYTKQNRDQYIRNLNIVFKNNKYVHVDFSNIEIMRHGSREGFYGVRLRQKWDSQKFNGSIYNDDGYLFLLWDFRNKEQPKIHVRAWSPALNIMSDDDLLSPEDFGLN